MLSVLCDSDNRINAACEWWLVNELGQQDWRHGKWVWVEQLELSKGVDSRAVIKQLVDKIAEIALKINPKAIAAYWVRRDKTRMKIHAFTKKQLLGEEAREDVAVGV